MDEKILKEVPIECSNCPFLEIIRDEIIKIKCFYRFNNKCLLGGKKNEKN